LASSFKDFPEYLELLKFQIGFLKILIPLDESPEKGGKWALSMDEVKKLQERAASSKRPISQFLEPSFFEEEVLLTVVEELSEYLMSLYPGGEVLDKVLVGLKNGNIEIKNALKAVIENDLDWFSELSDNLNIETSILSFVFETPLRPFFEEMARRAGDRFTESWWEPFCPICGRRTIVASIRNERRYMICTYCGAEYLVDLFLCINCGNKDPYTLGFLSLEEHPEYELNYCERCNHYIKVFYEDRLKRKIPKGVEDLLTFEIDIIAEHLGFKRI
jgi:formate dehydrogenase maturation protein FdhE